MGYIDIYTDGSCLGNPGPGGWSVVFVDTDSGSHWTLGGSCRESTTNNAMELLAVVCALEVVPTIGATRVRIHSDSSYVVRGVTEWLQGWKARGWKGSTGNPVAHVHLWRRLDHLLDNMDGDVEIEWEHVRAHTGIEYNELADELAREYAGEGD